MKFLSYPILSLHFHFSLKIKYSTDRQKSSNKTSWDLNSKSNEWASVCFHGFMQVSVG
ncbi:hypothetical protein Hanom_Chr05g00451021 [Helianthus anomalus]